MRLRLLMLVRLLLLDCRNHRAKVIAHLMRLVRLLLLVRLRACMRLRLLMLVRLRLLDCRNHRAKVLDYLIETPNKISL